MLYIPIPETLNCRPVKFDKPSGGCAAAMLSYMTATNPYYFPVMNVPVLHHRLSQSWQVHTVWL